MKKILSFFMSVALLVALAPKISFAAGDQFSETITGTADFGFGGACPCEYTCSKTENDSFKCTLSQDCVCSREALEKTWWDRLKAFPGTVWDGAKGFFGSVWNGITWLPRHTWQLLGKDFETIRNSVNGFSCWEHIGNVAILFFAVKMLSN